MAKTKISEFSSTPGNNTDIDGINIAEGCAPSGINDAIRELMSQLKDFQTGTAGDSFNGPVGTTTAAAGAFTTLSASSTVSGTGFSTYLASPPAIGGTAAAAGSFTTLSASSTVTLSGGTANGVLYLNGSKVATSGSALTFDGTTLQTSIFASTYGITVNRTGADGYLLIQQDGSGGGQIRSVSTGGLKFTASDASEWMRLTSTGLGIGTSSPSYKLDVAGQAKTTNGFIVNNGTNAGFFTTDGTNVNFGSSTSGKGLALFVSGSSQAALLDSSGNLGLGVTPSAWNTNVPVKGFQIGSATSLYDAGITYGSGLAYNFYSSNSGDKYLNNGYASSYVQKTGQHIWFTAASGTAGNAISFTQAMTLTASGGLSIGTTTDAGTGNLLVAGNISLATNGTSFQWTNSGNNVAINGASGVLSFYTGTSAYNERARIDSSGNLLVGTTSTPTGAANGSALYSNGQFATSRNTTSSTTHIAFYNPNGIVGSIDTSGSSTSYNTSSDYRLKDNPQPLTGSGAFIDALKPKTWNWKSDGSKGVGFIAHEVQEVSPGSVVGEKDGEQMQAMEYGSAEFIANIIAELQQLRVRVAQLEKGN